MDRRSFLFGAGASLIAAPAIVKASSLMPVRGIVMPVRHHVAFWTGADQYRHEFIAEFERHLSPLRFAFGFVDPD